MVYKIENETMIVDVTKAIEKERKNLAVALWISIFTILCAGIGVCLLIVVLIFKNYDDEKFYYYVKGNYERNAKVKKKKVIFVNYPDNIKHLEGKE